MNTIISNALTNNGINPEHLVRYLCDTLQQERDMFDVKKNYLTKHECFDYEIRLTNLEKLLVTLQIEDLRSGEEWKSL